MTLTLTCDRVEVTLVRICGRGLSTHQIRSKSEKHFVDGRTDRPDFQFTTCRSSPGDDIIKIESVDKSSAVPEIGERLATIDIGRKLGDCTPFREAGSPIPI